MILTVTMNPSIDIAYRLHTFIPDTINRAEETHKTPGGKGLNVTRVLHAAGDDVKATGLIGGKNGEYLKEQLSLAGIPTAFHTVRGDTRNCIAVMHEGKQTEILEAGPLIFAEEYKGFLEHFRLLLESSDAAVISGSLPPGVPSDCCAQLTSLARRAGIPVILDCSGATLRKALEADEKPTAIKPNIDELRDLLHRDIPKETEALKEDLSGRLFEGIAWIVVSLGAEGCFAKHKDIYYRVHIPKIDVISPVGSGDSAVAGIASGIVHRMRDEDLLKKANTLGMLNAMEKETGTVNMKNYEMLYRQITVTKV